MPQNGRVIRLSGRYLRVPIQIGGDNCEMPGAKHSQCCHYCPLLSLMKRYPLGYVPSKQSKHGHILDNEYEGPSLVKKNLFIGWLGDEAVLVPHKYTRHEFKLDFEMCCTFSLPHN